MENMNQNKKKKMEDEELITRRTGPIDPKNGILNKVSNLVSDNSTNERLAEIELIKNRMNTESNISDADRAKERLLSIEVLPEQQQQMLGSSGSLGLILGGEAKGLYNIGKYLAKNLLKKGAVKQADKYLRY